MRKLQALLERKHELEQTGYGFLYAEASEALGYVLVGLLPD